MVSGRVPDSGGKVVLVVEDDPRVGRTLKRRIEQVGLLVEWCTSIGEVTSRLANGSMADLRAAILDLNLPDGRGDDLVPHLQILYPRCMTLVVSGYLDGTRAAALLRRGVPSIMKPVDARTVAALVLSSPTGPAADPSSACAPSNCNGLSCFRIAGAEAATVTTVPLTAGEQKVLDHLLEGMSNKEIAAELGCSVKNVEFHVSKLLKKTGAPSRMRLMALMRGQWGTLPESS